jgi:hypothetical protein
VRGGNASGIQLEKTRRATVLNDKYILGEELGRGAYGQARGASRISFFVGGGWARWRVCPAPAGRAPQPRTRAHAPRRAARPRATARPHPRHRCASRAGAAPSPRRARTPSAPRPTLTQP